MTCRQLYLLARQRLAQAGVDSPGGDASLLAEKFLGLDRAALAVRGEGEPAPGQEAAFLQGVEERCARRPLQYILGEWEFMGLPLAVGEGVLCPREDTAVLVEALAQGLGDAPSPRGVDLCAGTGAVGLGLSSLLPGLSVWCVELSDQALPYLRENIARHAGGAPQPFRGTSSPRGLPPASPTGAWTFWPPTPPTSRPGSSPPSSQRCGKSPPLPWTGAGTAWCSTGPSPGCGCPS